MNIQTVAENLRNTIAGKEELLKFTQAKIKFQDVTTDAAGRAANYATAEFLEINIDELKRILQDVEKCVEEFEVLKEDLSEANGRVRQLERQASDDSWITNPDRSGGQFTQDEIDNAGRWQ